MKLVASTRQLIFNTLFWYDNKTSTESLLSIRFQKITPCPITDYKPYLNNYLAILYPEKHNFHLSNLTLYHSDISNYSIHHVHDSYSYMPSWYVDMMSHLPRWNNCITLLPPSSLTLNMMLRCDSVQTLPYISC